MGAIPLPVGQLTSEYQGTLFRVQLVHWMRSEQYNKKIMKSIAQCLARLA